jgi:hypothetical protein
LDFLCVVSVFCVALWLCDWYMSSSCVLFHVFSVHAMSDRLFFSFTCIIILLLECSVFLHVKQNLLYYSLFGFFLARSTVSMMPSTSPYCYLFKMCVASVFLLCYFRHLYVLCVRFLIIILILQYKMFCSLHMLVCAYVFLFFCFIVLY